MTEDQRVDTVATTTTRPARKRTHPLLLVLLGFALAAVLGYALYFFQVQRPTQVNRAMNTQTATDFVTDAILKSAKTRQWETVGK